MAAAATPEGGYIPAQIIVQEFDDVAKSALQEASSRATAAGVRCTTVLLEGRAAGAIVAFAQEHAIDAIVMGTQGKRGLERAFLGSTAAGVLRLTDVPTFVVHAFDDAPIQPPEPLKVNAFRRILVALDDSDPADAAMNVAADLAAISNSRLLCCNVRGTLRDGT